MASGVGTSDECMLVFQDLKLKKKYKFVTYTLSPDNSQIVVEKTGTDPEYEAFLSELPETECRYAVYDVEYEAEGGKRNKLCFFNWVPDGAKIKNKMLFASSKDSIRKQLVGISADIQGSDISEVDFDTVVEKLKRLSR